MAEINIRKGIIFALEEALAENLSYMYTWGTTPHEPKKLEKIWNLWRKQLKDEKKEIVPIIGEETFNVYYKIADAGLQTCKNLKDKVPSAKFEPQIKDCINMAKANVGLPTEDLPEFYKAIIEHEQNNTMAKKVYCRHAAINNYNKISVEIPEYQPIVDALKNRCKKCPFYSEEFAKP